MSVDIPVVEVVFGSVTPPQGDILELRLHLGCTKEVGSFDCLLQNLDGKYSPGSPNEIVAGNDGSISIGRGANCPLLAKVRVEDVEYESSPTENYVRVRGRCWGEKVFRRVVTKTYRNQKGEAIVKDLLDNYVGLSHTRDGTELVENTDTTYTLLEYEDTPVFDILKYIAESADRDGVLGFDFRVEYDGKFAFFPRNSKTSPISLSEKIEQSQFSKDIHRVRNKIMVYGAAEKPYPLDADGQPWSDSLTEDLTKPDNYLAHDDGQWDVVTGNTTLNIETTEVHTGSRSVKATCSAYMYYMGVKFTFNADKYVDCNRYPKLCFTLREDSNHNKKVTVSLEDKDGNTCRQVLDVAEYDEWQSYQLPVGKLNEGSWTMSVFNSGPFDWENLKVVRFDFHQNASAFGSAYIDRMHFGGARWEATEEDASSQSSYGLRELVEVDEELHSDNGCSLRAKALLDHLSQPAEFLRVRTTCLDYGANRLMPGDKIHVTLPNENVDSDFRIISVEYRVTARDQTLEVTLELGKEKPLLADYLYGLRSTTVTLEKLMRTKAGVNPFAGGGGGGGADEKVKVSSSDTTANYLVEKLLAGTGISLTKKNSGADEDLEIKAHREWGWADEQGQKKCFRLPLVGSSTVGWSRYSGNPVIPAGLEGTYDVDGAMHPSVCYSQKLKKFFVAYCGMAGSAPNHRHIIIAKSSDGKTGWSATKVLSSVDFHADGWWVQLPSLMYDDVDGKWKLWMALQYRISDVKYNKIAYAENTADDPTTGSWTNKQYFDPPYSSDYCGLGAVLRLGSLYYMLHFDCITSLGPLRVSHSYDGINWTDLGIALDLGPTGNWDEARVGFASVFWNLGVWYLFYSGWASGQTWRQSSLGLAVNDDPLGKTFTRSYVEDGKIFTKGESGEWDDSGVHGAAVIMLDDTFYLYYGGHKATGAIQIGLATLP